MAHYADWVEDDSILSDKEKERGYTGYKCNVGSCTVTVKCPPNSFPNIMAEHR